MLYRLPIITSFIWMDLLSVNPELDYSDVYVEKIGEKKNYEIDVL